MNRNNSNQLSSSPPPSLPLPALSVVEGRSSVQVSPSSGFRSQTPPLPEKPRLLDQLRREIRVRHYSIRTEHSYVEWVIRYVNFNNLRHPSDMGAPEISRFLSHLASDANVAASTQNQAA